MTLDFQNDLGLGEFENVKTITNLKQEISLRNCLTMK